MSEGEKMRLKFRKGYTDEEVNELGIFLRMNGINGHPAYVSDDGIEKYILKRDSENKLVVKAAWHSYVRGGEDEAKR